MTDIEKLVYDIICDQEESPPAGHHWEGFVAARIVKALSPVIAAQEREECAKVCEQPIDEIQMTNEWSEYVYMDGQECADAIRARGQG